MPGLVLVAIGSLPAGLLTYLAGFLESATGIGCVAGSRWIDPKPAYDPERGQYNCRVLLPQLDDLVEGEGVRILGVADVDLYSAVFAYVFGEAKLGGSSGLFSIHRLRPALYGLPDDEKLLIARARRESLHETGHLLGLVHCREPDCVMRFSGSAEEVDLKEDRFCEACRSLAVASGTGP